MATPTYEQIASITLSSSSSSVTFSSIPQDFGDLILAFRITKTDRTSTEIIPNGTSNSGNHLLMFANSVGTSSSQAFSGLTLDFAQDNSGIAHFMDYSATDKHKQILVRRHNIFDDPGSGDPQSITQVQRWANTSAITQLEFSPSTGTLSTGSTLSLYGVAK